MILKIKDRAAILLSVIVFGISISASAVAGIYVEEEISTNIPAKEMSGKKKTYISGSKALIIDPTISYKIIFDFNAKKVFLIDDVKKNLSISDLDGFDYPVNNKIYADFIRLQNSDLLSRESGLKRKIGNYNCSEKVVYIPRISALIRIWISDNMEPPPDELLLLLEKNNKDVILKKLLPLLKEKKSYIVESSATIVRPKEPERYIKTRLVKITNSDIKEDIFKVPEDYTRINPEHE